MADSSVLSVDNLQVRRDGANLLKGISWEVQTGQHWAILGANGSGKTTLLKILFGMMAPTSGEVRVFGKRYGRTDWNELRKKIGIVSHSLGTRIENHELAEDVILSGKYGQLNFWGKPSLRDRNQADKVLKEVGCAGKKGQSWESLSQGERQRLLIGRVLMRKAKLLFLDEPCAGLDPVARESFLSFLNRLLRNKEIPNCILVTHHVEEILPPMTRILCLREGSVVAAGKPEEVLTPKIMKEVYGSGVRLNRESGRYFMRVGVRKSPLFSG